MFLSLGNENIISNNIKILENNIIFPYIYAKYKYDDLLNNKSDIDLTNEEEKVLKIINRVYGYTNEMLNQKKNITNKSILNEYKDIMLELYNNYKDEKFYEKIERINGRYFFITPDVTLTEKEYLELSNIDYKSTDNTTFYVSRDSVKKGKHNFVLAFYFLLHIIS